jgi:DNA-binding CsgD family transcriptional regulator
MITFKTQGDLPDSYRALRAAAVAADSRSKEIINLLSIWRELAGGRCNVVLGFFLGERCYLVLSPATEEPASPIEARRLEILESVLGGVRQKCLAIDLGLAPSTVALQFKLALASIGVLGRPSRAHPLLMRVARAASEPAFARYSTFVAPEGDELRVISVTRPDRALSAILPSAEREVVRSLVEGLTYQEIAEARKTSTRTIANQVSAVFRRLAVSGRNELVQRLFVDGSLSELVADTPDAATRSTPQTERMAARHAEVVRKVG